MEAKTGRLPVFAETAPYAIPTAFYGEGLRLFQKRYVLRRNYVMMGIFALLLLSFVWAAVENPSSTLSYVLMMVCAAMIFLLWYNPRKQRRSVMEAVRELEGERYAAQHDGKVLRIRLLQDAPEEKQYPETRLQTEALEIEELEQFYLICDGKRMFYILPKAALSGQAAALPAETEAEKPEKTENRKEKQ